LPAYLPEYDKSVLKRLIQENYMYHNGVNGEGRKHGPREFLPQKNDSHTKVYTTDSLSFGRKNTTAATTTTTTHPRTMSTRTSTQRLLQQRTSPLSSLLYSHQHNHASSRFSSLSSPLLNNNNNLTIPTTTKRRLTSTPTHLVGVRKRTSTSPSQPKMKLPSQKSFEVMKREQLRNNIAQMPNDVGLLPETFVMPEGDRVPSLFADFATRCKVEKYRAWLRVKEFVRYFFPFFSLFFPFLYPFSFRFLFA
jgi:hypothetical protein